MNQVKADSTVAEEISLQELKEEVLDFKEK